MSKADPHALPNAVLFACTLNSVRSPMASAILRHLSRNQIYAISAGARRGGTDTFAIAAMEEIGIDISGHVPIAISDLNDTSFDLIITLSPEAHHQALELTHTMAVWRSSFGRPKIPLRWAASANSAWMPTGMSGTNFSSASRRGFP